MTHVFKACDIFEGTAGQSHRRSQRKRGGPVRRPRPKDSLLHQEQFRVARLGQSEELYLHCQLDGHPCQALVDTVSTITRPGVLPNTTGTLPPS
ncbi:hypothetical protein COCON_G00235220 [Conger conger]|uniref:Uncharacterized protein n=1 Tax=Conger conger TaxID=82655 RepID=A0A9Q1CUI3_CONCO|nr:hypothetical protein COCON_G00235220 [Conger conger]